MSFAQLYFGLLMATIIICLVFFRELPAGVPGAYRLFVNLLEIYTALLSNTQPSLNTWYNIVAIYDGSLLSLYINGVLNSTSTVNYTLDNSSEPLYIGKGFTSVSWNWYRWFKGKIDDIRIYNRALTDAEIEALYNE